MLARSLPFFCILVALISGSLWPSGAAVENSGQCMADIVEELESQCNRSSPSYEPILSVYRAQCCSRPLRVLAPRTLNSWLTQHVDEFEQQRNTPVNVTYVDPDIIPSTIASQLKSWAQQDLWIVDGASIPFLAYQKALLPLEQKVQDSPDVEWDGLQPLWADLSVAGNRTISMPISSDALLMYYRRDTFAALGRAVPSSWDELLQLAAAWNASTVAAAAAAAPLAPQHALCLSTVPNCSTTIWILSAVLASITQLQGPRTGWALALDQPDPLAAIQLLNGSAMELGLETLHAMAAASPPGLACGQPLLRFARGECLVTLDLGRGFRVLQQQQQRNASAGVSNSGSDDGGDGGGGGGDDGGGRSLVRGVVGVALPPGSTRVLDRSTGALVPATADACRVAFRGSAATANAAAWACAAPMLSYGGTFGVVSRRNGAVYQDLAFQFLSLLSSLEGQWRGVGTDANAAATVGAAAEAATAIQPVRESMLGADAAAKLADNSSSGGGAGYDLKDAQSYLAALRAAFTSPNLALEFSAPGAFVLRSHMDAAIQSYLAGTPAAAAADDMLRGWLAEWSRQNVSMAAVQQMLLDATPDPFGVAVRTHGSRRKVVWAVAGPLSGLGALLAVAALAFFCYREGRGEARLRRIEPPGINPQTSLVVTDIQDSTKMWELLHSDVMDVAIYHHHALARRLLLRFRGYESATEGDSFIIAFHTADDAVCFCAVFQQDLLWLPWPPELLALEGCKAVWVCKSEPGSKRGRGSQQGQQPLEVSRSGAPLSSLALLAGKPSSLQIGPPGAGGCGAAACTPPAAPAASPSLPPTAAAAGHQELDHGNVPLSKDAHQVSSGVQLAASDGGGGGGDAATAATAATAISRQQAMAGTQSASVLTAATAGGCGSGGGAPSGVATGASSPVLSPGVPPRYGRSTTPFVMSPSGSGPALGALGASPRQLSFLGRSLSRLGAQSIPSTSTAAAPQLPASPSAAAGAPERHFAMQGSSNYRTFLAAVDAVPAHPGGQDLLLNSPTSPVTYGGRSSGDGGGTASGADADSAMVAAGRAGLAAGGVMSFRESFRDGGGGSGGGDGEGLRPGDVASSNGCNGSDGAANCNKPPTLSSYPAGSALGLSHSGSLLPEGITVDGGGGGGGGVIVVGGGSNGDATELDGAARVPRSHSAVNRSLSASGRSGRGDPSGGGDVDGGAKGEGGEVDGGGSARSRVFRSQNRFSVTGCRSAARCSSVDTFDGTQDRTTTNSRRSRSTEIATVSEFNVVLESGGQHFVNQRSEIGASQPPLPPPPQQQQNLSWGSAPFSPYGAAGALLAPAVLTSPPIAVNTSSAAAAGSEPLCVRGGDGGLGFEPCDGSAAAAAVASTGSLGEGANVQAEASGPLSPPPSRAAARRTSVTFDLQSTGTASGAGSGSGSYDDHASASGSGVGGAAATACTAPPRASFSGPQPDPGTVSSVERASQETSSQASRTSPNTSHPPSGTVSHACRRAPSHFYPAAVGASIAVPMSTPPLHFSSRTASLRRRSDITAGGFGAAGGFPDYFSPYSSSYAMVPSLYGHGHGYDGALRPSPLGRGASQSSMSAFPPLRANVRGSHGGGGGSDATGVRSSNSRSLRGPSVDGDDTTEGVSYQYGQSSPLPQLFPTGALSDEETSCSGINTVGGGDGGANAGRSTASPQFSSYTVPGGAAASAGGGGGGAAATGRSTSTLMEFTPTISRTLPLHHNHQQHPPQTLSPSRELVLNLGGRPASGFPAPKITAAIGGGGGGGSSAISPRGPAAALTSNAAHPQHPNQHQGGGGGGFSRSLLALVNLPRGDGTASGRLSFAIGSGVGAAAAAAAITSGGGGSHALMLSPESRGVSMASMMRLASQHNLHSVGESLCSRWRVVEEGEEDAQLVFRGLRVRMGMHSGLSETTDLAQLNRTANRMQYTGVGLSMVKAVADCAHGGQVLLSEAAFTQLAVESLRGGVMVLHMGEHLIKDDLPSTNLYWGCPRGLQGRMPTLRAVRSSQRLSLGVLDAPAGAVVVVFVHVVGAMSLLEWRPELAATALALFRDHVSMELIQYQGYLVEAVDGLVLASFSSAISGLAWVAKCQSDMAMLPWPEELMCHEACEELCVTRHNPATGVHEDVVVFRGLRLKAGVDMGRLRGEINCVTGRMSYRGRAMNRAARIVAAAGSGQILASSEAWRSASVQPAARLAGLTGSSMGQFLLKGVAEPIEVYQIKTTAGLVSRRARTILTRPEGPLELDGLPISDPVAALQHHVSINNATSPAAAAAAAASAAALAQQISAASSAALRANNTTATPGFGAAAAAAAVAAATRGGVPSRLMLGRMHSMSAALRREESLTRRPLSRNASRRSSRRSSMGSQYSNLAANTMVALARGSHDGRQDVSLPSRVVAAAAAVAAAAGAGAGPTGGAAHAPTVATAAAAAVSASASVPGGSGPAAMDMARSQRFMSQPQLQDAGDASLYGTNPGFVSVGTPTSSGGGGGAGAAGAAILPSPLASGTGRTSRTSRNSAGDPGGDIDGARSSNPRSSNASTRSGHPMWAPRVLMTSSQQLPLSSRQTSGAAAHQHLQQHPPSAAANNAAAAGAAAATGMSPAFMRSGPTQPSLARHISAFIRSALTTTTAAAAAAAAAATSVVTVGGNGNAVGPQSSSNHPMLLPSPRQTRGSIGVGLYLTNQEYRSAEAGFGESTSGAVDPRLLSTGGVVGLTGGAAAAAAAAVAAGGGGSAHGVGRSGGGGGGGGGRLLDRIPTRLQAVGGRFRAGSFSGHSRRRGVRASDFGLTVAAAASGHGGGGGGSRSMRSPPEPGRRFMSTATGLGYTTCMPGTTSNTGLGLALGSPGLSPTFRPAGGTGGYDWRRDAHAAAAAGTAAGDSGRRRDSRAEAVLLDRYLPEDDTSFVIVVGEEDLEGGMDSDGDGDGDAGSFDGDDLGPPPPLPATAAVALQAGGVDAGDRAGGGSGPPHRASPTGLSITATLMRLDSGRTVGSAAAGGIGSGGVGVGVGVGVGINSGSIVGLSLPQAQLASGPNVHL